MKKKKKSCKWAWWFRAFQFVVILCPPHVLFLSIFSFHLRTKASGRKSKLKECNYARDAFLCGNFYSVFM